MLHGPTSADLVTALIVSAVIVAAVTLITLAAERRFR